MQVNSIISNINKKNNPNFGHSFRVSICLKNEGGCGDFFVSPSSQRRLYRTLNSKIVGWLNEDYLSGLRSVFGITRKTNKAEPLGNIHKKMVEELKTIDSDYASFGCVRSVYNGGRLGYIATGIDVPIIENIKGLKQIGIAKADSRWYNGTTNSDYVRNLTKLVHGNNLEYVQNPNVILRSKNDKEIMLRAVFKETGKNKNGEPFYELDRYEFHENKTNPILPSLDSRFLLYKYNPSMNNEIRKTVKYHADKIAGRKVHFENIDQVLKK